MGLGSGDENRPWRWGQSWRLDRLLYRLGLCLNLWDLQFNQQLLCWCRVASKVAQAVWGERPTNQACWASIGFQGYGLLSQFVGEQTSVITGKSKIFKAKAWIGKTNRSLSVNRFLTLYFQFINPVFTDRDNGRGCVD